MTRKALLIIIFLLVILIPVPFSAHATGPYTATLKYYDDVQITYSLKYPNGGRNISDQIYCSDPFVKFHSMANTAWPGGVTTDTMSGYTEAAVNFVIAAPGLSTTYDPLPALRIYGSDDIAARLPGGDLTGPGGVWTSGDFYLKIPDDRSPAFGDLLTIKATAMTISILPVDFNSKRARYKRTKQ